MTRFFDHAGRKFLAVKSQRTFSTGTYWCIKVLDGNRYCLHNNCETWNQVKREYPNLVVTKEI
jgi:hypothetical protein